MSHPDAPADALRRLANGYQVSQAIHVAAALGIADLVAAGPRAIDDLAAAAGADERSLYRLLRALASVGVFREEEGRRFALTPIAEYLRRDVPRTLYGWASHVGRPYYWQAWAYLLHSVRTGENAFAHVHGTDVWTYRADHPGESAVFDRAMADLTAGLHVSLLDAYDFGRYASVVDVGGGTGALLAALLSAHPGMRGVLLDQPHVVSAARDGLDGAGVLGRCEIVSGSFFDAVPAGADAYVLKAIIHDWEDEDALRILGACRRAAAPGAAVLVIERELGAANENAAAKFGDLNMLVGPGGRERTTDEYASLLAATGFRFAGVTPSSSGWHVFEGVAE